MRALPDTDDYVNGDVIFDDIKDILMIVITQNGLHFYRFGRSHFFLEWTKVLTFSKLCHDKAELSLVGLSKEGTPHKLVMPWLDKYEKLLPDKLKMQENNNIG